jgi:hypothetical protein
MLLVAMTNNSSADLAAVQAEFQAAAAKVDQAEDAIQTVSSAHEAAKLTAKSTLEEKERQDATQLQKLADERQQSELVAQNAAAAAERLRADNTQPSQPNLAAAAQTQSEERWPQNQWGLRKRIRNWAGGDSNATVATVMIQNSTPYQLNINFTSSQQHIWPAQGRAFVAQPGETITVRLAGTPGEGIFYKAWAAQNPYVQWASCDCGPDNRLTPLAIIGQNGDDNPQSITLVQN